MNGSEDNNVDELIAKAFPDRVPPMATARLRSQLADFRARLATVQPPSRVAAFWIRPVYWGLGITLAAAVTAAVVVVGLVLRAQTSFAEVAAMTLKQPWIHAQQANADGTTTEAWYSASQAISALRRPDSIEYRDYRLQVYFSYDLKEQVLYRSPDVTRSPSNYYESMAAAIAVLFEHGRTLDKPLEHLDFLSPEQNKMKVLDQEMKKVTENGQPWLDYRMTVSAPDLAEPAHLLFRVDEATKLPQLCRFEGKWRGKLSVSETRFDYPEKGPADVYAVGVPKNAKFVDRVPAGDLMRILETLAAGRERMDNYLAIFVMHLDGPDSTWWTALPMIMYRKGDKFRTDYVSGWSGDLMAAKRPAEDEDRGQWWHKRVRFFRFYPQYVMRGSMVYTSEMKNVNDSDGSQHAEIVSVHKYDQNTKPGESIPVDYSMRPEFACRPPLGIGDQHLQPTLNLNPTDGPPGCILLIIQRTSREGRINDKGIGLPDEWRYWLDSKRDYIVMRSDMIMRNDAGKEEVFESDTVEEVAKSPGGIWYATRIRRSSPPNDKMNGKKMDQVYDLYVDFDVDLPDAFFNPPTPGRLH